MFQVTKRDGSIQEFDPNKIASALAGAGADADAIKSIMEKLQAWFPTVLEDNKVSSLTIRAKILELLNELDAGIAQNFESFSK